MKPPISAPKPPLMNISVYLLTRRHAEHVCEVVARAPRSRAVHECARPRPRRSRHNLSVVEPISHLHRHLARVAGMRAPEGVAQINEVALVEQVGGGNPCR